MAASSSDHFRSATSGTRPQNAYLTSSKSVGASTISVSTTVGWATSTGTDFIMFIKDTSSTTLKAQAGTLTTWVGTVSGTTINNLVLKAGVEPVGGYPSGENSVVIATPTAAWNDALISGILTQHNQDGTHNAITAASLNVSGAVTVPNLSFTPDKVTYTGSRAVVVTQEGTGSTTYTDLTTVGPSVTITVGPKGIVDLTMSAQSFNGTAGGFCYMSFVASGANTIAAADGYYTNKNVSANQELGFSYSDTLTGLTPGSTTFKLVYKVGVTGGANFSNRKIIVTPR
jgi:hypothetical protein